LAWKLKVNIDKTKIVSFTNGKLPQNLQFTYSNSEIEIVKEFNYLGLLLTKTGNFKRAIKTLADQSNVRNPEKRKIPQSFYFTST
jgi:hypothetical protein